MTRFDFYLPWPPTTNNLYAAVPAMYNKRVLSKEGKAYVARVGELVLMDARQIPRFTLRGKLAISIIARPPDVNRARDLDNLLKAPLDALKKCGVIVDDCHIDRITITRGAVQPGGRLEVTLQELDLPR